MAVWSASSLGGRPGCDLALRAGSPPGRWAATQRRTERGSTPRTRAFIREWMLVKNWEFTGKGSSADKDYPYLNFMGDAMAEPKGTNLEMMPRWTDKPVWQYTWHNGTDGNPVIDVKDGDGVKGQ